MSKERIPLVSLVGPEGSGKTTQGLELAKQLGLLFFSTGDKIRYAVKNDKTEFGDACRAMAEKDAYLDPKLIIKMLGERFREEDAKMGVVLDGGFRTLKETVKFQEVSEISRRDFSVIVIYLRLPWHKGVDRILTGKRDRPDSEAKKILSHLSEFSKDLGEKMTFIRENYPFEMILCAGKSFEEINLEILTRLKNREETYPQSRRE